MTDEKEKEALPDIPLSKYDAFLAVAGRKEGGTLEFLTKSLWQKDSSCLQKHLVALQKDKLIDVNKNTYIIAKNSKAEKLFELLTFAISYDYDYNFYLSPDFIKLLSDTYALSAFTENNISPDFPNLKLSLIRLMRDKLAIFLNYKPLMIKFVHNYFFDLLCEYFSVKIKKKFFENKIKLDTIIMRNLNDKRHGNHELVASGARFFFPTVADKEMLTTPLVPKSQKLLKFDIVPENPEIFDAQIKFNFENALKVIASHIDTKIQINGSHILEYHKIVMKNLNCQSVLRDHDVAVKSNPYFKPAKYKDIPKRLDAFFEEYRKRFAKAKNVPMQLELAAYVANEIIYIQPFADGNSRTAILMMYHVLGLFDIPIKRIPQSYEIRYLQLTKGAKKRNDNDLVDMLKEILLIINNAEEFKEMLTMT
ncbi:MAG: Fic family protein [bacterium]|nr:Fic family protein [bacterium]